MNNKIIICIFSVFLLFPLCYTVCAQSSFDFRYDSAGNQVQRIYLVMLRANSAKSKDNNSLNIDSSKVAALTAKMEVTVYPNPTKGELKLDINGIDNTTKVELTLFNPRGQLLLRQIAIKGITTIDMFRFPSGWYLLKIKGGEDMLNFKIVKE